MLSFCEFLYSCSCVFVVSQFKFLHSTPTGSSEKNTKRKMRREKRKLMKKKKEKEKLKSADTSDSLMSELPFALTSPTAWKELGCMLILITLLLRNVNYKFFLTSRRLKAWNSDLLTVKVVPQPCGWQTVIFTVICSRSVSLQLTVNQLKAENAFQRNRDNVKKCFFHN